MIFDSDSDFVEARQNKLVLLALMLNKLSRLYPQFADTVTWERAHLLLADFCVPEGFRNTVPSFYRDSYYQSKIAAYLGISFSEVQESFSYASQFKESQS